MAKTRRSLTPALGASVAFHGGLLLLLLILAGLRPDEVASKTPPIRTELVFLEHSGPGGGGGGNPAPAPPQPMKIPAHNAPVIPVVAVQLTLDPPKPTFDAPVQTLNATVPQGTGVDLAAPPGRPGGGGKGPGLGPGDGAGVGPGTDGGTGGGPRRVGDGVTSPVPIKSVKPSYTNAAMQARISGTALVECTVLADGTVTDAKIVGSLDRAHGLDLEALKAARQWSFKPGTFDGRPVDVIVRIALEFNLH